MKLPAFLSRLVPQKIVAYYEAAQASKDRSTLQTTYQDPDKDMTPAVRRKIAAKSRYFVRNSALFSGIVERMVTYVVGAGINPEPVTSDPEFNKKAQAAWDKHKDKLDIETGCSWDELVALIYEAILVDNGIYSILTYAGEKEPRLQLVECHRLAPAVPNDPLGGIILNADGSPKSYRFLLDPRPDAKLTGAGEDVDAEWVVPHYFQKRARQYFGLTIFAPALNVLHNVEDLLAIEIAAAKEVCSTTNVIRTKTGEAPAASLAFQRYKVADSKDNATNSANEKLEFYKKSFAPTTKYIGENDEFSQHVPQRPSPTWIGMMDFLEQCVCMPLGMPPSTLLQIKVGGHDSRRDLAAAGRVIERHQWRLAKQLQRIYEHVLLSEFEEGELPPPDWNAVEWQFAGSITGDAGRMADNDRQDIAMGTNSLRNHCGANGLGGVEKFLRTRAQDITLRDRITAEVNEERAKLNLPPLLPSQIFNFDHKSQPTVPPELIAAAAGVEQPTQTEA